MIGWVAPGYLIKLNRHPLNKAAKQRLEEWGAFADPNRVYLLQLAITVLGNPDGDATAESILVAGLERAPKAAFRYLAEELELEPEDLLRLSDSELADEFRYILQPSPPRD